MGLLAAPGYCNNSGAGFPFRWSYVVVFLYLLSRTIDWAEALKRDVNESYHVRSQQLRDFFHWQQ
jgi:hypothetical protein